ncbi:MAG TPA: hypothetical protein VIA06_20870 [Candidatus Dormibacteraeota bacterium]|jgi:hypothetical protein|nr:hypothetical protein [Candidatus Dormibacteraeota bacterium]
MRARGVLALLLVCAGLLLSGCSLTADRGYPRTLLEPVSGAAEVSRDQRLIMVLASWRDCERKPRLAAVEGLSSVALELVYAARAANVACLYDLRTGTVSTQLSQPLDGRVLVQALSGKRIPTWAVTSSHRPSFGSNSTRSSRIL